jgi:DNA-3-methyladenine glycosylase
MALNISREMNGVSLLNNQIWLEDKNIEYADNQILITPRIGVEYAAEDALLPYRFVLKPDIIQSEVYKYSNTHI